MFFHLVFPLVDKITEIKIVTSSIKKAGSLLPFRVKNTNPKNPTRMTAILRSEKKNAFAPFFLQSFIKNKRANIAKTIKTVYVYVVGEVDAHFHSGNTRTSPNNTHIRNRNKILIVVIKVERIFI